MRKALVIVTISSLLLGSAGILLTGMFTDIGTYLDGKAHGWSAEYSWRTGELRTIHFGGAGTGYSPTLFRLVLMDFAFGNKTTTFQFYFDYLLKLGWREGSVVGNLTNVESGEGEGEAAIDLFVQSEGGEAPLGRVVTARDGSFTLAWSQPKGKLYPIRAVWDGGGYDQRTGKVLHASANYTPCHS